MMLTLTCADTSRSAASALCLTPPRASPCARHATHAKPRGIHLGRFLVSLHLAAQLERVVLEESLVDDLRKAAARVAVQRMPQPYRTPIEHAGTPAEYVRYSGKSMYNHTLLYSQP